MEQAQRYPLSWPRGWKRTQPNQRGRARFGKAHSATGSDGTNYCRGRRSLTLSEGLGRLLLELDRLCAISSIVSTNMALRLDGLPRSGQRDPDDPGVAVYFKLKGKPRCLACDRWISVADNIAAIAAHVSAIRAVDRYGVGTMEQAFAGYAQLQSSAEEWRIVLGLDGGATLAHVEAAYKELARKHHPDIGGDPMQMARVNQARDAAREELGA